MKQLFCIDCQTKARTNSDTRQRMISLLESPNHWVNEDVCQCCLYPCKLEASNKRLTDALEMTTTNLATENKRLKEALKDIRDAWDADTMTEIANKALKEEVITKLTINFNNPKTQLGIIRNALSLMPASRRKWKTKNSPNWSIVREILTIHTNRGGSGSSGQHCKYLGIDPDGYDFK